MYTYQVTVSAYWHNGKKFKRGDIIEAREPDLEGGRLQRVTVPTPEPIEAPKPKRTRRKKVSDED